MNSDVRRRLKALADDLEGPLGRIPLDRALRGHLGLFAELRREGCTWSQLARALAARRIKAVIPPNPTRKHPHRYDKTAYKGRNVMERMFCRLKDFRRIATRYDRRADTFLSAILLAAAISWWAN